MLSKKPKESTKENKENTLGFLCPSGIQFEWLLRASPHSLASQTRGYAPQTVLGFYPERVALQQ